MRTDEVKLMEKRFFKDVPKNWFKQHKSEIANFSADKIRDYAKAYDISVEDEDGLKLFGKIGAEHVGAKSAQDFLDVIIGSTLYEARLIVFARYYEDKLPKTTNGDPLMSERMVSHVTGICVNHIKEMLDSVKDEEFKDRILWSEPESNYAN